MKQFIGVFTIMALVLLAACDNNRIFEENRQVPGGSWKSNEPFEFEVLIADTNNPVNAYINIRNTSDYGFSNIYLFLTTTFPNGKEAKDTLNCLLADDKGKWLGQGAGDLWNNQIMLKHNVYFKQPGKYKFKLEHAMRTDPLTNITDVGFRIEKSEGK